MKLLLIIKFLKEKYVFNIFFILLTKLINYMGIGDWGLGIGDWGLGIGRSEERRVGKEC